MSGRFGALILLVLLAAPLAGGSAAEPSSEGSNPVPHVGDAGRYELISLVVDGDDVTDDFPAEAFEFEVRGPEPVTDAYGQPKTAWALQGALVGADGGRRPLATWLDPTTMTALASHDTIAAERVSRVEQPFMAPSGHHFEKDVLRKASRSEAIAGLGCGLLSPPATSDRLCPWLTSRHVQHAVAWTTTAQGHTVGARFHDGGSRADAQIAWGSDHPYATSVHFTMEQAGPRGPGAVGATVRAVADIAPLRVLSLEIVLGDRGPFEHAERLEAQLELAELTRGQRPVTDLAAQDEDARADRGPAPLDLRGRTAPLDAYGPASGGEPFPDTLEDAFDLVLADLTLVDFQTWLLRHDDARVVRASHVLPAMIIDRDGPGVWTHRWILTFQAPGQAGEWTVVSKRSVAGEPGQEHVAPTAINEASWDPTAPPPPARGPGEVETVQASIDRARQVLAANNASVDPAAMAWWYVWDERAPGGLVVVEWYDWDRSFEALRAGFHDDYVRQRVVFDAADGALRELRLWRMTERGSLFEAGQPDRGETLPVFAAAPAADPNGLSAERAAVTLGLLGLLAWLASRIQAVTALFTRTEPDELLEHQARKALYDALVEGPGQRLSELADHVGEPVSTVRYHLERLVDGGFVTVAGGRRHHFYFAVGETSSRQVQREACLRVGRAREAYHIVEAAPGINLVGLAERLGVSSASAIKVVDRLVEQGLLQRRRAGREVELHPAE